MREILFRSKRLINGEWVEGFLIKDREFYGKPERHSYIVNHQHPSGCFGGDIYFEVDPETVGQYTGMTDKNGKQIFEGDILQVKGYGEVIDRCVVGYGIYTPFNHSSKSVGFYLCWKHDKEQLQKYANLAYWVEEREAVCIGNIHDNPELIAEVQDVPQD